MNFRNDGIGDSNILQNQFTAYLQIALRRRKQEYLTAQSLRQNREYSFEDTGATPYSSSEIEDYLSYEFQLENENLLQALAKFSDRDRLILAAHVLEEIDFHAIAEEYGMTYKGLSTAYYRLIKKLRKHIGGGEQ